MRVGIVDVGTNSTRLLVAEVDDGRVRELARDSRVTRLGQGLGTSGRLAPEARERVFATLSGYRRVLDEHGVTRTLGVLTSAARDAADGPDFVRTVAEDFGLDARVLSGEDEARMTFRGATAERDPGGSELLAVVDIGGGSTEVVAGAGGEVSFFTSMQAGVVRHSERHVDSDPPAPPELEALREDVRALLDAELPAGVRARVSGVVGVAGTATSVAAMDLGLAPYDPARVHGHRATRAAVGELRERLARLPEGERREVAGLHPDRAPTIVAGLVILEEVLEALGADALEVSERDILHGAALLLAD